MTAILISLMITFGFISSSLDYDNLDQDQVEAYEAIIIDEGGVI